LRRQDFFWRITMAGRTGDGVREGKTREEEEWGAGTASNKKKNVNEVR
jgi:hypothetical protein